MDFERIPCRLRIISETPQQTPNSSVSHRNKRRKHEPSISEKLFPIQQVSNESIKINLGNRTASFIK